MKFSKYNVLFEKGNKKYLYNVLSTALVEINEKIYFAVKNNKINQLSGEEKSQMQNLHFVVSKDQIEENEYLYYFDSDRLSRSKDSFRLILITTYNCNLKCPYCMQGQDKAVKKVDEKSINTILKYIDHTLSEQPNVKKLFFGLFGGEPMMNKEAVYLYCDGTKKIAEKYNCSVQYTMTSNMTLLDEKMIDYMKKYQIGVQVSIDGTREEHDKRRIRKDNTGTYDTIIENLKILKEKNMKNLVTIRLNIDSSNIKEADKIMSEVRDYSDDIYFGFLDSFNGANDSFEDCISPEDYPSFVTDVFSKCYKQYKLPQYRLFGKKPPCSMVSENRFYIDYKLNMYKCEMLVNHDEVRAGYLSEDGVFHRDAGFYSQLTFSPLKIKECFECKLLPVCGGGCPAKGYVNSEDKNPSMMYKKCLITEEKLIAYLKNFLDNQ